MRLPQLLLLLVFMLLVGGWISSHLQTTAEPSAARPLKVALVWVPNPQFAGFFLAEELGYYAEEGIQVDFLPYQTQKSVRQQLVEGEADLGIDSPDQVLQARGDGQELVALAAIFRISPIAFAARGELHMESPADLQGKRVGSLPDGTTTLMNALLAENGLPQDVIERVPVTSTLDAFLQEEVDVIPIYIMDETYILDQRGIDYQLLLPQDYGVDTYGDTLITTQSMIESRPQATQAFVQASLKGWRYMIEHPDQALAAIKPYMHEDYQHPGHQEYLLHQAAPLIHTGLGPLGWMQANDWQRLYEDLLRQGLIARPFDIHRAFTNQFLDINN
ncbi:ABC transporter substrate-binding protein [Marinospirillum perlucidum]|uniref:ABC transporter substrate-binding protein n=1 Tax=Marinospirillum perlucidum TaxID=1982602 RepID=UPI000DF3858E|nr:ABC transporter substrate-binding protein [Marinospirillum perlucidum]